MRIAVAFHSGYGHTARQAKAVADGVREAQGVQALLVDVGLEPIAWDDLRQSDGIIFGCPTYMGSPSAVFKKFMEESSSRWMKQEWADKVAAGFTNSSSQSGDKLNTLISLAVFAAQHSMIWVGTGMMPSNSKAAARGDINYLGSFSGAMAQSPSDASPAEMVEGDLEMARLFGARVNDVAGKFAR